MLQIYVSWISNRAFIIIFFLRYYEGQFAPISEMDVEDVELPAVSVTEAAQKVKNLYH